jgi:hypothetical protein
LQLLIFASNSALNQKHYILRAGFHGGWMTCCSSLGLDWLPWGGSCRYRWW